MAAPPQWIHTDFLRNMLYCRILQDARRRRTLRSLVLQSESKKMTSPKREKFVFLFNAVSCLDLVILMAHLFFIFISKYAYLHAQNTLWTLLFFNPCKVYLSGKFLFLAFSVYNCRDVRERTYSFIKQSSDMKLWRTYLLCLFPLNILAYTHIYMSMTGNR